MNENAVHQALHRALRNLRAQLEEVPRALGLAHEVERRSIVLQDSPVGVVFADWRVDFKPAGKFDKEFDVFTLVKSAGEFTFDFGIPHDVVVD